ncbi:hypothetical protein J6590_072858 [Homalodisca vitripennis]|nr:hypothetical protein J6590_072858 [Homalodisca vitripennis]
MVMLDYLVDLLHLVSWYGHYLLKKSLIELGLSMKNPVLIRGLVMIGLGLQIGPKLKEEYVDRSHQPCLENSFSGFRLIRKIPFAEENYGLVTIQVTSKGGICVLLHSNDNELRETSLQCVNRLRLDSRNNQRYNCSKYLQQFS